MVAHFYARVVQLAEASGLGPECWEFESLHGYHYYAPVAQLVEQWFEEPRVSGSNPFGSTN